MYVNADFALNYLVQMSTDLIQATIFDSGGKLLATTLEDGDERARALMESINERCLQLGQEGAGAPDEAEIATGEATVFLTRGGSHALVALFGRSALPALAIYDMRAVLADLEQGARGGEQ